MRVFEFTHSARARALALARELFTSRIIRIYGFRETRLAPREHAGTLIANRRKGGTVVDSNAERFVKKNEKKNGGAEWENLYLVV